MGEHDQQYQVKTQLEAQFPEAKVIVLDAVTDGQLCTILTARESIDSDEDVLVISSDTYVTSTIGEAIRLRRSRLRRDHLGRQHAR